MALPNRVRDRIQLTSEHAIRGTYFELAVKLKGKLVQLIEVKSAGSALDDRHVKQAIDYASNQKGKHGCVAVKVPLGPVEVSSIQRFGARGRDPRRLGGRSQTSPCLAIEQTDRCRLLPRVYEAAGKASGVGSTA
jgi:hypothetical protein